MTAQAQPGAIQDFFNWSVCKGTDGSKSAPHRHFYLPCHMFYFISTWDSDLLVHKKLKGLEPVLLSLLKPEGKNENKSKNDKGQTCT